MTHLQSMLISTIETNNIESTHTHAKKHVSIRKTSTCRNPFARCPFHSSALGTYNFKTVFFFITKVRYSSVAICCKRCLYNIFEETLCISLCDSEYFTGISNSPRCKAILISRETVMEMQI